MPELYYKPSGKFSPISLLYFVVFMVITIPVLSIVYIYAIRFIPFIYLNFLIAIACGCAVGFVMMLISKWGKIRNTILVICLTIVAMIVLKYFQWCIYIPLVYSDIYHFFQASFLDRMLLSFDLFLRPDVVIEEAIFINANGTWSLGSSGSSGYAVTGIFLSIVWIGEFILMLAGAIALAFSQPGSPYSENTNDWYKEVKTPFEAGLPADPAAFKARLETGDFRELISLVYQGRADQLDHLSLVMFEPKQPTPVDPYYITISQQTTSYDKKGAQKVSSKPLMTYLSVNHAIMAEITQAQTQRLTATTPVAG